MYVFSEWLELVHGWVWGPVLIGLLIGVSLYLTLMLKGLQIRYLWKACKLVVAKKVSGKGDISPFQALTTSLAGTVGTGNIAGVATAVVIGGIGSVFWIWSTGILVMVLKYSEALLAVNFREVDEKGQMAGGPMYYIEKGLGWKWLAICFSVCGILASFGIGNLVQMHSIADVLDASFGVPPLLSGILVAVIIAIIVLGGIRSIGRVTSILVPSMAIFYVVAALLILVLRFDQIPSAIALIFRSAFTGQAAVGGFIGSSAMVAMRMGVARGIFSNEAGMGSASIAAAAAKTHEPARQGLIAMTGTFIDTVIICSITGLVLAVTGVLGTIGPKGLLLDGAPLTAHAFSSVLKGGKGIVSIALVLFAYSTILGWAYYGEKCIEYLFGVTMRFPYRIFFCLLVTVGALLPIRTVWIYGDIANGLMAFPNLIGIIGLSGVIAAQTRAYLQKVGSFTSS